jgi:hypothetical protein
MDELTEARIISLTFAEPGQTRFAIIVRYPRKPAPRGSSADPVTPPRALLPTDDDTFRHG